MTAQVAPLSLEEFLRRFCPDPSPQEVDHVIHRGNTPCTLEELEPQIPTGFRLREQWSEDTWRRIWTSDSHRAMITFCEDTVAVELLASVREYRQHLSECAEFYSL